MVRQNAVQVNEFSVRTLSSQGACVCACHTQNVRLRDRAEIVVVAPAPSTTTSRRRCRQDSTEDSEGVELDVAAGVHELDGVTAVGGERRDGEGHARAPGGSPQADGADAVAVDVLGEVAAGAAGRDENRVGVSRDGELAAGAA